MYHRANTWWTWNQDPLLYEGAAHTAPYMVGATLAVALVGCWAVGHAVTLLGMRSPWLAIKQMRRQHDGSHHQ